jgi:hypothetical protein
MADTLQGYNLVTMKALGPTVHNIYILKASMVWDTF